MTIEQIQQIKQIITELANLTPEQAKQYLDANCSDEIVRKEVESMLSSQRNNPVKTSGELDATMTHLGPAKSKSGAPNYDGLIGQKFNNTYLIQEKIGEGGMGAVFRATHMFLGTQVAIKVMNPTTVTAINNVKRFQREAKVGWNLSHPNIIKVFEFSQTPEGMMFMVMEFVKGETLRSYIKRVAPITLTRALEILKPLCHALDTAHRRNILHRDLKPANILISNQDDIEVIKLADFGIVKFLSSEGVSDVTALTETGTVIGSLDYMSPEQLMNYNLGPTSDIYSLGVILHEMLTSKLPIEAYTLQELIRLKSTYPKLPPPSSEFPFISKELDEIFRKVMTPFPPQRYQKASDFYNALSKLNQGGEI